MTDTANTDTTPTLTPDQQEIERLRGAVSDARRRHEADIAVIGERLLTEAEDRDWCAEFDEIIEDVNRNLHVELPTRTKEFEVTVTLRLTVKGPNDDAADQAVQELCSALYYDADGERNGCEIECNSTDHDFD